MSIECEPMPAVDEAGWCEWRHPMPGFVMQCCDCGLLHDVEFEIVPRDPINVGPLNPGERDDAMIIWRMRRHEEPA